MLHYRIFSLLLRQKKFPQQVLDQKLVTDSDCVLCQIHRLKHQLIDNKHDRKKIELLEEWLQLVQIYMHF